MLELLALATDAGEAQAVGRGLHARVYVNTEDDSGRRPYSALIRAVTDQPEALDRVADVGLYVAYSRVIKPAEAEPAASRVVASFPLRHHPTLSHRQADDHWRDVHAPLALRSHSAMCDYTQLSIVATLAGLPLDGIALCAFPDRDQLRHRFFDDDDARSAVHADVASFADTQNSPRRVVLSEIATEQD